MLIKTASPFYFYLSWKGEKRERMGKNIDGLLWTTTNTFSIAPRPLHRLLCRIDKGYADGMSDLSLSVKEPGLKL